MATAKSAPAGAAPGAKTAPAGAAPGVKGAPAGAISPGAQAAVPPDGQAQDTEQEIPKPNVKTMPVTEYLAMVDKMLQKGLEIMVVDRPENPVQFLSNYLTENDTQKKPPQFHRAGPPAAKSACGCRPGPPLPCTSCGCFKEPGWEPNPEFPPVGWPTKTSIEYVEAIDTIALP